MARRKRRSRSYGAVASEHAERSRGGIRVIRELTRLARENLAKGDCMRASGILISLAQEEGAYVQNRHDAGAHTPAAFTSDRLFTKFARACIRPAMPRSSRK
jgi:hypothetical protein